MPDDGKESVLHTLAHPDTVRLLALFLILFRIVRVLFVKLKKKKKKDNKVIYNSRQIKTKKKVGRRVKNKRNICFKASKMRSQPPKAVHIVNGTPQEWPC